MKITVVFLFVLSTSLACTFVSDADDQNEAKKNAKQFKQNLLKEAKLLPSFLATLNLKNREQISDLAIDAPVSVVLLDSSLLRNYAHFEKTILQPQDLHAFNFNWGDTTVFQALFSNTSAAPILLSSSITTRDCGTVLRRDREYITLPTGKRIPVGVEAITTVVSFSDDIIIEVVKTQNGIFGTFKGELPSVLQNAHLKEEMAYPLSEVYKALKTGMEEYNFCNGNK